MNKPLNQKPRVSHTPGTWIIDVNEKNEHLVCSDSVGCIAVLAQLENESQEAANARLIAAAPDMKQLLVFLRDRVKGHDQKLIDICLAKAEGRKV